MPPEVAPEPEPDHLKQIRTFEGDVAEAIKKQNESLISIQRSEATRREVSGTANQGENNQGNKKALLFAILTILLIALGALAIWYGYTTYRERTALPVVETPANQFVYANSLVNIDASTLSRQAVIDAVNAEKGKSRSDSDLEQIEFLRGGTTTTTLLKTADFLTRLNVHASNPLVRALDPLFMLSVLGTNPAHTILLVKIASFENAFPGMLEWESRLAEDLLPLFQAEEVIAETPSATKFVDTTIQNRDARILRSSKGQTVLLYAFFDNSLLIMTDDEDSFRSIVKRLENDKLSR